MSEYGDRVVFKLMNGDQCMARFLKEEEDHIVFEDLVLVKPIQIPTEHGTIEKTVTSPYCPIAEDTIYRFNKQHVLFVKALDANVARMYDKMIKQFAHDLPADIDPDGYMDEEEHEEQKEPDSFLIIPDPNDIKIH